MPFWYWIAWFVSLIGFICGVVFLPGCGPTKPTIETGIVQSFQAANASMLSQVKWDQVLTHLQGKIGPETQLTVGAYQVMGGEVRIVFHGAELSLDTQGAGSGGGANYNAAVWPEIMAIQQRWERADDAHRMSREELSKSVADAIIAHINAPTTQPAG
jgi:hypothetical protein